MSGVWIVRQCEVDADNILGVFDGEAEARAFAAEVSRPFDEFVIEEYRIGWRYDKND